MRITQWGEFAVHFCIYMAKELGGGRASVNAAELASAQSIDHLYAQQILQRLRRGGITESIRGPQGGYRLVRAPSEITLYDILIAAEGDTLELLCEAKPLDSARCAPTSSCGLRTIWQDLKEHLNSFLVAQTLADIVSRYPNLSEIPVQIGTHKRELTSQESSSTQ